ncbi:DoxX family protein [Candidatus Peregrinibacteria bacterium CG10_big_fil_rev_8_21_14_0_10_36_19]|nr:MAG: DoxX family protein [Candidatus Peregrinibacteria bacterium CG10_big_fil_rev_8_21_14_0_10_36_19]
MAKSKTSAYALVALRLLLGWLFLYSGVTKALNPEFTAAGLLGGAKTFHSLYAWFASDANIGWVNFMNIWGQIFIGAGLMLGAFTRYASYAGVLLMGLYYFPGLEFPYVEHGFLVDDHVIYALAFVILATHSAGETYGLDAWLKKKFKWKWL